MVSPTSRGQGREVGVDGTKVTYVPSESGVHSLGVSQWDKVLEASPFLFYVSDTSQGLPYCHGTGLTYGLDNSPATFHVVCGQTTGDLDLLRTSVDLLYTVVDVQSVC